MKRYLVLENGEVFAGLAFGAPCDTVGELVFTTGMNGYIETLTDPSYCGQIVLQTFPLIGNYGIIPADFEGKCCVRGYVVREQCQTPSNFRCEETLDAFLKANNIPGIAGIDTRAVTRILREAGTMNAAICDTVPDDLAPLRAYRITDPVPQVPFSVPTIILFMLIAFELLQEAGLRLPNSIGQTVSIIGALLVGQSAVDAKVVSPVAIIVVALAGIAGYTLPNQELSNAVRLLRLGLVLAAALAGLFGILAALGLVIWYLCTIDSDGVAYMAPFVDSERPTIFRTLLRRPQPDEKFRPPEYDSPNRRRQR